MVGTSATQTVAAAPKENGWPTGIVVVAPGTVVVVAPGRVVVVTPGDVVVVPGEQASGNVVERVTDSAPSVYVIVTGPVPAESGYWIGTVSPERNSSAIDPPVENVSVPIWPWRSGRTPNVMAIVGSVPSGHSGSTSMANRPGVGRVVVVLLVVVVPGPVVVGPVDVVVEPGVVVVGPVVDVGAVVVVVVGGLGHSLTSGSGCPMSKAMTTERPWRSWKN
jgi:hypothetical protein